MHFIGSARPFKDQVSVVAESKPLVGDLWRAARLTDLHSGDFQLAEFRLPSNILTLSCRVYHNSKVEIILSHLYLHCRDVVNLCMLLVRGTMSVEQIVQAHADPEHTKAPLNYAENGTDVSVVRVVTAHVQ